jgi:hypothetical protein
MAAGFYFRVDANAYLLLGVPLTVAFQLAVARRRLSALWVRDAAKGLDRWGWLLGLVLAVLPITLLVRAGGEAALAVRAWLLCATAGSVLAAFALRSQHRQALRHAVLPAAAAVTIGVAIMSAAAVTMGHSVSVYPEQALGFFRDLWLYFCVGFVLEEVTFRGLIDTHVHPDGSSAGTHAWVTALFVSALWGLWHLPIVASSWSSALRVLPGLLLVHVAIGIPLSLSWRRGGTLALPSLAHAIIDAYRNVVTQ